MQTGDGGPVFVVMAEPGHPRFPAAVAPDARNEAGPDNDELQYGSLRPRREGAAVARRGFS